MINLIKVKKEFISGTTKGAFSGFVKKEFDVTNIEMFKAAVSQGYDDAKRTFNGISNFWALQENKDQKDAFFGDIADKIQNACNECPDDFDSWHEETCKGICGWLADRSYETVAFGQAQKIVNMAFKYLFCLDGADKYEVFKKCHMPLDSFTLEWYKRYVWNKNKKKITDKDKWSNLKEDTYKEVACAIKEYLDPSPLFNYKGKEVNLPRNPLEAEFYIWPEMQMHLSTEGFLFSFSKMDSKEKKAWKKESASKKLDKIKKCIDDYKKSIE